MCLIKTKESTKDIKVLDKTRAATHRAIGSAVHTKDVAELVSNESSASEFGAELISDTAKDTAREAGNFVTRRITRGRKRKATEKVSADENKKNFARRKSVKGSLRTVKTAEHADKTIIKTPTAADKNESNTAEQAARAAKKAKKAEKAIRESMRKAAQSFMMMARSLMKTVKRIIAATKSMVAAIAAGGSTAAVALVAICAVALLLGSSFGVFFSNETDGEKMREVVAALSKEYYDEIKEIEGAVAHDKIEYESNDGVKSLRWQDIISVYAVKLTANNSGGMEAVTIDDEKKELLRSLMWDMSAVDYSTRTEIVQVEVTTVNEDGEEVTELQDTTITVLVIEITHKTPEEMSVKLGFDSKQNEQLELMREGQYASYWAALLGGYLSGDGEIVMTNADWTATGNFSWPLPFSGDFNSGFGYRADPFSGAIKFHGGIDLGAPGGTSILAADGGTVVVANATDPYYGYGYYVMIDHGNGFATLYGHCSTVGVVPGQTVSKGEVIAAVGTTGNSTGNHLHFEVYQGGVRIDPMGFFS